MKNLTWRTPTDRTSHRIFVQGPGRPALLPLREAPLDRKRLKLRHPLREFLTPRHRSSLPCSANRLFDRRCQKAAVSLSFSPFRVNPHLKEGAMGQRRYFVAESSIVDHIRIYDMHHDRPKHVEDRLNGRCPISTGPVFTLITMRQPWSGLTSTCVDASPTSPLYSRSPIRLFPWANPPHPPSQRGSGT